MRDQVRQEANLTLQQENLTTLQDTVAPDEVALPQAGNTFVWPQPSFEQVLCRWYKLSVPTWSYTQSQDTTVLALDISKALFNVQTLFDRIKRYRYWRSGVKVKLQVNSTPFHYGSLMCGIVPHYVASEASFQPVDPTTYGLSGLPCSGVLSANTGKPLELTCPYQVPNEYLDITQTTDVRPFYLYVVVMNPLKIAGGATNPTLSLSVFAQFTDFKIFAPSEITANSSSKKIVKADAEQRNATKQGTLGKVAGAVSDVAGALKSVPVIGGIASAVAPISRAIGGIFDYFGWDKPSNISSQTFIIARSARGMQHSSGQDPCETLGLKPDQKVSTETSQYGYDDPSCRSLLKLVQTPMWAGSFTIANNQATETVFKHLWIRPYGPDITDSIPTETQRHDYLSFYSQFFKSCRGGYRYYIHFDTSSYTTARVRLTFEPSNATVATVTDGGDSFSRIIDVNGATTVCVDVPYAYPSARMPVVQSLTTGAPANGQLLFSLVNPIQTNGSSADVIFVNIFRCALDDFRFYQPKNFTTTKQYGNIGLALKHPLTRYENQLQYKPNSLAEMFSSIQPTSLGDGPKILFDRTTEDEEVMSHNDYLHRYHLIQGTDSGSKIVAYPTSGDPWYYLQTFRAFRGAQRFLSSVNINGSVDGVIIDVTDLSTQAVLAAGAYLSSLGSTDVPIEVPYNNNVRFLPLMFNPANWLDAYNRSVIFSDTPSQLVLWAAGDDYTVGLRKHPILITITIP